MGVLTACTPRPEVLKGDLEDAIFAADFGDLIAGVAPAVYGNARVFFENTHPAQRLATVVRTVFGRLANPAEGGAALRLSTGFGGGKTHTLMTLWHLARNVGDPTLGTELLPAAGRPGSVTVAAVDAGKAGVPLFATHGGVDVHSLWGELFFRLGGAPALHALGAADGPEASPNEAQLQAAFPSGPVLILLDELVIYMARLSERGQGNLLGFVNALGSVARKRPQTVLVVTDPAGQAAYARESGRLGEAVAAAAIELDEMFGRTMPDFDPIGDESARVIVRRLFERIDVGAAQAASALYYGLYERVSRESPGALPPAAATAEYARRIVESYPFHPRLLDTAQGRLAALQDFQQSRGVLRLFARILRDVLEKGEDLELISAGEIDWSSPRIQADLLQRLNREAFKAAVSADVDQHAGELDGGAPRGIHRRVASALLLESLPMQPNSGLDPADATLAAMRAEEAGPEPAEALDRLAGVCWHTYPLPGGRGWQFRYQPNVLKQIEERKGLVSLEDARSRVLSVAQQYFAGPFFRLAAWPANASQVHELAQLQLALCENEKIARSVTANEDDADPTAPIPRNFQNAVVAVAPTPAAFDAAIGHAQRLIAADDIEREHRSGDAGRLVREQLQRLKPQLQRTFRLQTCRASDRVILANGASYPLEEQFQVPEDQMLQSAQGQGSLRRFLEEKGLIYRAGDALDPDLLTGSVLPGTVPVAGETDVYTAKAVHERFLGAPGLRLLPDGAVVRQSLLRAVEAGKVVVRLADGRAYDAAGQVAGPPGARRRMAATLTTLALDDTVQVTPTTSAAAATWTEVDSSIGEGGGPGGLGGGDDPPPPPPPGGGGRAQATTWEAAIELAEERPLFELRLVAQTTADAAALLGLAQPLGADSLALSVSVGGILREGGTINFAASALKPTHPTKPLDTARTIANALGSAATYEAELALGFGAGGRAGLAEALRDLADRAPPGVQPLASFERSTASAA